MLTSDLVRARVVKNVVRPDYVDRHDEELISLAGLLIDTFEAHVGRTRRVLQSGLDEIIGTGTDFLLQRGLAKLLLDRSEFSVAAERDPIGLREEVFAAAGKFYADRDDDAWTQEDLVRDVENSTLVSRQTLEDALYADLAEEQRMREFRRPTAEWLLDRYNTALAQAVLLRASRLDVEIRGSSPARLRELFRSIKFHQLLYTVRGSGDEGYTIHLDGPLSLFRSSQRYGLQMANFLPTLLAIEGWKLEARVLWGKQRAPREFHLSADDGLVTHRELRGQWQPEEIGWLSTQFAKLDSPWKLSEATEVIDLGGQGLIVPDFVFIHSRTGRRVILEIFGYWRRAAIASRIELLEATGHRDIILAVSKELRVAEGELEGLPAEIYVFRHQPVAREVEEILRRFESDGPPAAEVSDGLPAPKIAK
jgi:predicted nuclease of restriction endonuclease-like RecB superfamily